MIFFWGETGNDVLTGGPGNDTLTGGGGFDTFQVDSGTDTITDLETGDVFIVSSGATLNTINVQSFIATSNTSNNGTAVLTAHNSGSNIDLTNSSIGDYTLAGRYGVDTLIGGTGNDIIVGGGGHDTLVGGAGNDQIWGMEGDDILTGGAGADTFYFGLNMAHDTITDFNEIDGDTIDFGGITASEITRIEEENNVKYILSDGSSVSLINPKINNEENNTNSEEILGTQQNDTLNGNQLDNKIFGYAGDDILTGEIGNDILTGGGE